MWYRYGAQSSDIIYSYILIIILDQITLNPYYINNCFWPSCVVLNLLHDSVIKFCKNIENFKWRNISNHLTQWSCTSGASPCFKSAYEYTLITAPVLNLLKMSFRPLDHPYIGGIDLNKCACWEYELVD